MNSRLKMILIRRLVVMGKYNVNFSFRTMISPGSLPNQGILSPINRRRPITIIRTPRRMRSLPKAPKPMNYKPL
jgi:hypothetical protein